MSSYQPTYTNSYALLIGVDAYEQLPPLNAAVYGAARLKDTLSNYYNFDATLLTDHQATSGAIFNWLSHIQHVAGPDDRVLIYFAGHGLTRGSGPTERGYLALTNTQQGSWHTALKMDDITEEAQYLQAKHLLYLLDCCFSGLALEGRSADNEPRELTYYLTRPVRYAISAGGKEIVDDSYAPDGQTSLFAYHLLRWLDQDYHTPSGRIWRARDLGNYLEEHVARDRHSGHLPRHGHLSGSGGGDFIFHWDTGPRLPLDLDMALRAENGYIRWGAVASLIDLARREDQLADIAIEHLEEMAAADPDERVQGAAQSYFDELEALQLAEKERARQEQLAYQAEEERAQLADLEVQLQEARRKQAESEAALRQAEKDEQRRLEAIEAARKARNITPPGKFKAPIPPSEPVTQPDPTPPIQNSPRRSKRRLKARAIPWASIGGIGIGIVVIIGIIFMIALSDNFLKSNPTLTPSATKTELAVASELAPELTNTSPGITSTETPTKIPSQTYTAMPSLTTSPPITLTSIPTIISTLIVSDVEYNLPLVITDHNETVQTCAFSSKDRFASGDLKAKIMLWDTITGQRIAILNRHGNWINDLVFSPDGTYLVSAASDGQIIIWNGMTGEYLKTLNGHYNSPVRSITFSSNGEVFASGADNNTVVLWDTETFESIDQISNFNSPITAITFISDTILAVSTWDSDITIIDTNTGQPIHTFTTHDKQVNDLAYSPNKGVLVSASDDNKIILWNPDIGLQLNELTGHNSLVGGVAFTPDGKYIISGGAGERIMIWDTDTGELLNTLYGHFGAIDDVDISSDGSLIVSCGADWTVRVWPFAIPEE